MAFLDIPLLADSEAKDAATEKWLEVTGFVDQGARASNDVARQHAGGVMGFPLKAMMSLSEDGDRAVVYLYNGAPVSWLRLYSFFSRLGRVYLAARAYCEQRPCLDRAIGKLEKNQVGQAGPITMEFGDVRGVSLSPSVGGKAKPPRTITKTKAASAFGIQDVTPDFSLDQYDATVKRVDHPLVVTGPPGVGKTTVAMKRLCFLMQLRTDVERAELFSEMQKKYGKPATDFSADTVQVLVRKPHLQHYLASYASDQRVSPAVVEFLDKFLTDYASDLAGTRKPVFKRKEAESMAAFKEKIEWEDILSFVAASREERDTLSVDDMRFLNGICLYIRDIARDPIVEMEDVRRLHRCASAVEAASLGETGRASVALQDVAAALDTDFAEEGDIRLGARRRELQETRKAWKKRIKGRISRLSKSLHVYDMLYRFYLSDEICTRANAHGIGRDIWEDSIEERREHTHVYVSDLLILAALREAIEEIFPDTGEHIKRLSHIVIDEAQLMPPLLLRLILERWCGRMRSCTLVGDPKQSIIRTADTDYFLRLQDVEVCRLTEVFRVTMEQFRLLESMGPLLGFDEVLRPGRTIPSGPRPALFDSSTDFDDELRLAADILAKWYRADRHAKIVLVPCPSSEEQDSSLASLLQELCGERGIHLVNKFDGQFSIDEQSPVLAHIDSLIGLEFDYLLLFNTTEYCQAGGVTENGGAIWIAASRAKKQFAVSLRKDDTTSIFRHESITQHVDLNPEMNGLPDRP